MGHKKHDSYITLIWIVSILVSVGVGTFILTVLETTMLNVWISRIVGCAITVIAELLFYHLWIRKIED